MISKTGNNAFTLVEVVLAVAILAIGITGVMRAFIVSLEGLQSPQEYIADISLAKQKMAELFESEIKSKGLAVKSDRGTFAKPYDTFEWTSDIAPSADPKINLARVSVVSTSSNGKEFSLVTYVQNQKEE